MTPNRSTTSPPVTAREGEEATSGQRPLRAILLGPPGAGKGTQAAHLAEGYGVPHVATGDILRTHRREGTELGRTAGSYLEAGELVPDRVVIDMVAERLSQDDAAGFILDGFPRTLPQGEALEELLGDLARPLQTVLWLDVPEEEIVRRLTGRRTCPECKTSYHLETHPPEEDGICDHCGVALIQREDDREELVRHRLQVYRRQTEPLLTFYRERGLLRDVDAVGPVAEVTERALAALDQIAPQPRPETT